MVANTIIDKHVPLASLCLKINLATLTGQAKDKAYIEEEADAFISQLTARLQHFRATHTAELSPKKKKGGASATTVPFFDIEYQNIVESLTGHPLDHDLELTEVEQHLPLLRDMFGLKFLKKSIAELKNESVVPLGSRCSTRQSLPRSAQAAH